MPQLSSPILDSLRRQQPHPMFRQGGKFGQATRVEERYTLQGFIDRIKQIPAGKYALVRKDGGLDFLEVVHEGNRDWVYRLHGAPGDFRREKLSYALMFFAAGHILADLPECAKRFGQHFRTCGRCDSPLTNAESRAFGLGPVCRKAYSL